MVASWLHVQPHVGPIQELENDQTLFITSVPLSNALNPRFIRDSCLLSLFGWKSFFSLETCSLNTTKNTGSIKMTGSTFSLTFGIKSGSVHGASYSEGSNTAKMILTYSLKVSKYIILFKLLSSGENTISNLQYLSHTKARDLLRMNCTC